MAKRFNPNKPWKNKKDYKQAKSYWNSNIRQQRSPAGYQSFQNRERAWLDRQAQNKQQQQQQQQAAAASNNNSSLKTDPLRSSGEFEDIKAALALDALAGQQQAKELEDLKAKLALPDPAMQAQIDALTLSTTDLTAQLSQQAADYQAKLDQAAIDNQDRIDDMNDLLLQQQTAAASAQSLLQSQLQTTQNALQAQQALSANMANAYVPKAQQSAATVSYGDARTQTRKTKNNSLSGLSIVSGVGGGTNALTGLKIPGTI